MLCGVNKSLPQTPVALTTVFVLITPACRNIFDKSIRKMVVQSKGKWFQVSGAAI